MRTLLFVTLLSTAPTPKRQSVDATISRAVAAWARVKTLRATFEQKLLALAHFEGAMKPFPHSRSLENVKHLAHVRGAQIGVALAEAFMVVRDVTV